MHPNPFPVGSVVTWNKDAPETWRHIWSPGPMGVVSAYWHDGTPSEYLMRFVEKFGGSRPPRTPGWIITVEYDPDASGYYDPPLSLLLGEMMITKDVHEMWLILAPSRG